MAFVDADYVLWISRVMMTNENTEHISVEYLFDRPQVNLLPFVIIRVL